MIIHRRPKTAESDVVIRQQKRKSLAFQITPSGPVALIPNHLDPDSETVQTFITHSLASLPKAEPPLALPQTVEQIHGLVQQWSARIGVQVSRIQIRAMVNKWGSISTAGTLTLADDIRYLPPDLAEYVVVHELLHLKFPDHRKGWRVSMGMYLADWQEREWRLVGFVGQE